MTDIQEMCGPTQGHRGFVDQTECILRVMPRSDNPKLQPSDPYIGLYTREASRLLAEVKRNSESDAAAKTELVKAYADATRNQELAEKNEAAYPPQSGASNSANLTASQGSVEQIASLARRMQASDHDNPSTSKTAPVATPPYQSLTETQSAGMASRDVGVSSDVVVDTLEKIQSTCDANRFASFKAEVLCVKKGVATAPQLSGHEISGDLTLYMLTAEDLSNEAQQHRISFNAARVSLQKAFIEFRNQINRRAAEVTAREYTVRRDAEALQDRENERQRRQAQSDAAQARLAAQAQAEADHRDEMRQAEVDLCFSEVMKRNQTAGQNLSWLNSREVILMQVNHIDTRRTCENDPEYYQIVPIPSPRPPPSITTCQEFGVQITCTTNQ